MDRGRAHGFVRSAFHPIFGHGSRFAACLKVDLRLWLFDSQDLPISNRPTCGHSRAWYCANRPMVEAFDHEDALKPLFMADFEFLPRIG